MPTVKELTTLDPYQVKDFLIDLAESYFKTEKLDTYEAGFLGYFIQSLSHLTSDMLFLNAMSYNEAFTTKAVLDTSLVNLANMFDYNYKRVVPASGLLSLQIPINNQGFNFTIPMYSRVAGDDIPYRVTKTYTVYVDSPLAVRVYSTDKNNVVESIPTSLTISNQIPLINFNIEVSQVDYYVYEFTFPKTYLYKFYHEYIKGMDDHIYSIRVFVNNQEYKYVPNLFEAGSNDKVFSFVYVNDTVDVIFGNGVFGHLPDDGDSCKMVITTTRGADGNVIANKLQLTERIEDSEGRSVVIYATNELPIINGADPESTSEMRGNIIAHISSLDRLVSKNDYKEFQRIIPDFENVVSTTYLLRRDVHMNEISNFIVFFDKDGNPLYTDSISFETNNTSYNKDSEFDVNGATFVCPFRINYNPTEDIKHVHYEYVISDIDDAPYIDQTFRNEVIGITKISFSKSTTDNDKIYMKLYMTYDGNTLTAADISAKITLNDVVYDMLVDNDSITDTTLELVSSDIPVDDLPFGSSEYSVKVYWQGNLHSMFKSNVLLRENLDDIVWSNYLVVGTNRYKLYNVPVIEKQQYQDNIKYIDQYLLQQIALYKSQFYDYNMMTDVINIKFARTYGRSTNMRLNSYNQNAKYTYSNDFYMNIPFKVSASVMLKHNFTRNIQDVKTEVRDIIYTYFRTHMDFDMDILRSNVVRFIHDVVQDIAYCEITTPDREIVYSFDVEAVPTPERDKLLSFVPEYIWLKKEDIVVDVQVLSM